MAGHPLRPATDHRLGRPLPHQLANPPQAPPKASCDFARTASPVRPHAVLPTISGGYPPPRGRSPTCSSPVRHVSHPKVTPFDLHALGTPPALILSQDQTLHQIFTQPLHGGGTPGHPGCQALTEIRPRPDRGLVCCCSCCAALSTEDDAFTFSLLPLQRRTTRPTAPVPHAAPLPRSRDQRPSCHPRPTRGLHAHLSRC